jgi:hypothetical protein
VENQKPRLLACISAWLYDFEVKIHHKDKNNFSIVQIFYAIFLILQCKNLK